MFVCNGRTLSLPVDTMTSPPFASTHETPSDALFSLVLSPHHLLVVAWHSRVPHAAYFPSIFHYLPLFPSDWNLAKNPICRSARSLKKEALCLSPPVSGLLRELWDTSNYCSMPHAAPGNWDIIAVFVYTHHRSGFFLTVIPKYRHK